MLYSFVYDSYEEDSEQYLCEKSGIIYSCIKINWVTVIHCVWY